MWFTQTDTDKIASITTSGAITEFSLAAASSYPMEIVAGPDGNLWFTDYLHDATGRITTAGVVTEFTSASVTAAMPTCTSPASR